MKSHKNDFINFIHTLQNEICSKLEEVDGKARFKEDKWERDGGGGGKTRILQNGNVFEKGGVNTSIVYGNLPKSMQQYLNVNNGNFFACGLSLVIHPHNPMVPTVHANYRYFELYDKHSSLTDLWFGGGADLTPYYLYEEDAIHFHKTQKDVCDKFDKTLYPKFKKDCDNYFYNHHRDEARGIGGLFFDRLRNSESNSSQFWYDFTTSLGKVFTKSYIPIANKRKDMAYTENQKYWQEIRRGRYVEFNLIHDKGTLFGLKTKGRIESILMSLPAVVRWDYDLQPKSNSEEEKLLNVLKHPKNWV